MVCRRTIGVYARIGAEKLRMYAIGQVVQWTNDLPVGRRVRAAGRMLERPSGGGTAGVVRWLARTRQAVHPFTHSPPSAPLTTDCPLRRRSLYMPVFMYTRIQTHTEPHRGSFFLSTDLSSPAHSLLLYLGDFPFPSVDSSPL